MAEILIEPLRASPEILAALSEILTEVVAGGGSVSFMHPLAPETAQAFWDEGAAGCGARPANRAQRLGPARSWPAR